MSGGGAHAVGERGGRGVHDTYALGCGAQRAPRVEAGEEVRVSRRRSSVSTILDDETAAGLGCG